MSEAVDELAMHDAGMCDGPCQYCEGERMNDRKLLERLTNPGIECHDVAGCFIVMDEAATLLAKRADHIVELEAKNKSLTQCRVDGCECSLEVAELIRDRDARIAELEEGMRHIRDDQWTLPQYAEWQANPSDSDSFAQYVARVVGHWRDGLKVTPTLPGYFDFLIASNAKLDARIAELEWAITEALQHVNELRDAWERGIIDESDCKGGLRSNRNVEVETKLRQALEGRDE